MLEGVETLFTNIVSGMGKTPDGMANDRIYVQKSNGAKLGPYKATVDSRKREIEVFTKDLDVEVGDTLLRTPSLGLGREEVYEVVDVHYKVPIADVFAPYTLEVKKQGSPERQQWHGSSTFNITGAQNVQIGDHNVQNVVSVLKSLSAEIDNSDASVEEKRDAKQRLHEFLKHPIISGALGGATGQIITGWFGK
jgi:hypothetical protein